VSIVRTIELYVLTTSCSIAMNVTVDWWTTP